MKKLTLFLSLLIAAVMLLPGTVSAQQMPQLGVDPEVRIGHLPNGLTYYIRHNNLPKGQADFYIAQKVGSVLENDDQQGLAHFLEHMCFNGTTHFPGKNLINWLESVGVKFGENLNAATWVDKTVYNIKNVPVERESVQDSCLLILHDWANDLLLLPEEIDAERAVIHEEWRTSNVGQMRILTELLPKIYPGNIYGHRLPIGTMEVVDNFPHQALRDYYEKWYRPDLQGIIVVGDIDVDRIENKIKEMFSDIEMPENPAERIYFPVEDTKGTIYAIGHDPEQKVALAQMMFKTDAFPDSLKNTQVYLLTNFMTRMVNGMLNTRLAEIASKPDAPFAGAQTAYGDFLLARTKNSFDAYAMSKTPDEIVPALTAVYREILRAKRGGFTVSEYERECAEYMSQLESAFNSRNKLESNTYVQEYVNNFISNEPIPTIEEEYKLMQSMTPMVQVQMINQLLPQLITDDNRVVLMLLPDNKEGRYPTEEEIAAALAAVDAETIEPYKEEVKSEPLIPSLPAPGKVVKEEHSDQWDATVWTLSNGATVIVKPTHFKDNEVLFGARAANGTSGYGEEYYKSLAFMPTALRQYGLGTYSRSDLNKYLSGKQVVVSPSFSLYSRSFNGFSTPKDLPTMMELLYMNFTGINFTPEEFEAMQKREVASLHNSEKDPQSVFMKRIYESLYSSPRLRAMSIADVEGASLDQIKEICKAMTANAGDFTFTFIGNVDPATLKPLVEQYIASLPGKDNPSSRKFDGINKQFEMKRGVITDNYTTKMETPQTWIYLTTSADMPYNGRNNFIASMGGQILSKRLNDIVREKEGAVYSIGAQGEQDRLALPNTQVLTAFPMKPELKEKVLAIIAEQINALASDVKQTELDPVKEFMVKEATQGKELNGSWLAGINGWLTNGVDTFNGNIATINSITVDDIQNWAKEVLSQKNCITVALDPEK